MQAEKISYKRFPRKGVCSILFCTNSVSGNTRYCGSCRKKIWRKNNPKKAYFLNLQSSARRRGIPFDLSYPDFEQFAYETRFLVNGKNRRIWSVDRINDDPRKGYHGYRKDNIQKLKTKHNSRKFWAEYRYNEYLRKMEFIITKP